MSTLVSALERARVAVRATAAEAEVERLRGALEDAASQLALAADTVEVWAAYADPYIQEKHGLIQDVHLIRLASEDARQALTPQEAT